MTIYDEMKKALEQSPKGRERKNKNRFLAYILEKKWLASMGLNQDQLSRLIVEASSLDRAWRQVLEKEPELRGSDYDNKEILEQEKQLSLGYTPGYDQDLKKGALL